MDPHPVSPSVRRGARRRFTGTLEVRSFHLANGLAALVVEDPQAPVVAWQTWYRVGSALEEPGRTGLAHLFEHMMFKATRDYPDGRYSEILEGLGARGLNAWTWLDETVYTVAVPASEVETVARLEASRMRRLLVEEEPFRREREVVLNERSLRVDNDPDGLLSERLHALAFRVHPYGRPTIGHAADVAALTVEDCRAFYDRWYAPDQAVVVLVGDLGLDAARDLLERWFGDHEPSGAVLPALPPEPVQEAPRFEVIDLPVTTDRLLVGWRTPGMDHPDVPALQVLDALLTAGRCGRLGRRLVDGGLAGSVSTGLPPFREEALMELDASARPGVSAEILLEAVEDELSRIAAGEVTSGEVARAVRQVQARTWPPLESAFGKADFLGLYQVVAGSWAHGLDALAAVARVGVDDVARVCGRYCVPARRSAVGGRAPDGEAVSPKLRRVPRPSGIAPVSDRRVRRPGLGRGEVVLKPLGGATAVLGWDDALPVVHLRLAFPVGSASDPPERSGLAAFATHAVLKGTRGRPREAFEEALESLGARLGVSVDRDTLAFDGSCPSGAFPAFCDLVAEALADPAFCEEEIERLKDEALDGFRAIREDDADLVGIAFEDALYGPGHPYAAGPVGTEAGIRGIEPADCAAFHAQYVRSEGAVVGVSGAFGAGIEGRLERLLAGVQGQAARKPLVSVVALSPGIRLVLVDKPDRTQAQVMGGLPGSAWGDPWRLALRLGTEVLGGGSFSGRLMKEVREARGWSYGAYAWDSPRRAGGAWRWWISPDTHQALDAIRLVLDLVEAARRDGVTEAECDQARAILVRGAPFLQETVSRRVGLAVDRALTGFDVLADVERLRRLDRAEVNRALAERLTARRHLVAVVAGAELAKPLETLGPVEVVPWTRVAVGAQAH
ncbi:MAG: insulinase family protein [Deltaproteobacteria bacterium]|nr:insulinase family protein [Deltaproteobacteria bacterium]